jgi:hypothetical protein
MKLRFLPSCIQHHYEYCAKMDFYYSLQGLLDPALDRDITTTEALAMFCQKPFRR